MAASLADPGLRPTAGQHGGAPPPGRSRRSLAIVGTHPATRELAPYDDPRFEIWLFNESPMKPEIYRRWDASLQIHRPEVYTSTENWVNKDHWAWLQQDHGERRIFMQAVDPRVPNSVAYPLEGVLSLVPYRYLRSSPAMGLALAIYLGYQHIRLYGSELTSGTEYGYQAINYAFWIGFAHGQGIDLDLRCWQSEFEQPIYGFEGEPQLEKAYFAARLAELAPISRNNEQVLTKARRRLEKALEKNQFDRVGEISVELELAALAAGEVAGAADEAARYQARQTPLTRQEFEKTAALAQRDGPQVQKDMDHAGGKCEYVWNVWRQTGQLEAKHQLRTFLREKIGLALEAARLQGVNQENLRYLQEYDRVMTALGGTRALHQLAAQPADKEAL